MLSTKAQKLLRGEMKLYTEEGRQSTKLKVSCLSPPCDLLRLGMNNDPDLYIVSPMDHSG